ncbi:MAG: hypothetical protein ACI4WX_00670 [Aristaeellaceae bacterium]
MKIEIIYESRLMGSYQRGTDTCWWTVWHNKAFNRFEAYTEGDMRSECDCHHAEYGKQFRRFFSTQNSALAYLASVIAA